MLEHCWQERELQESTEHNGDYEYRSPEAMLSPVANGITVTRMTTFMKVTSPTLSVAGYHWQYPAAVKRPRTI